MSLVKALFYIKNFKKAKFVGDIELDERYFGVKHKGNVGRSTKSKILVFGILKRKNKLYIQIIPNASNKTLKPIIQQSVSSESVVFTDS